MVRVYLTFIVTTVIIVIPEQHLPGSGGPTALITNAPGVQNNIIVFHQLPGELVGLNSLNSRNSHKLGGGSLPPARLRQEVRQGPQVPGHLP